jgi:rhodanese-related sulfurtransferase
MLLILLIGLVQPATAEVIDIDNQQLKNLMARGVPVVDVRTPQEWRETGLVDGSHGLTFFDAQGRYDTTRWLAELSTIAGSDEPVILICRSGNRSARIAAFLDQQAGYQTVYNVRSGIRSWLAEGNQTRR